MNDNVKHTPGPWKHGAGRVDGLNGPTVRVYNERWSLTVGDHAHEQDVADARLIAAAPDLLEAAIAAVAQYDTGERGPLGYEDRTPIGLLRAAIQKATGVTA